MDECFDIVGDWTEIKLRIVREYAKAYATILHKFPRLKFSYIDAFAGAGTVISKDTGEKRAGSSIQVLEIEPKFDRYHLIEMDHVRAESLRQMTADRSDVTVYEGDCNSILIKKVFPQCRFEDFRRALCLFDPYGLNPNWTVVESAGNMRSVEFFLNFMIMDANRNVLWANPDAVRPEQIDRMNVFWGDDSWREASYEARRGLFGDIMEKKANKVIIDAYRKRLKEKAGFKYVPDPMPMRNKKGVVIYYLLFASNNEVGNKIAKAIFRKYQIKGFAHGA